VDVEFAEDVEFVDVDGVVVVVVVLVVVTGTT